MSTQLALDESRVCYYREIGQRYLSDCQINVYADHIDGQEHSFVICVVKLGSHAHYENDESQVLYFHTREEAEDYISNCYLPSLGFKLQLENIKLFQASLVYAKAS